MNEGGAAGEGVGLAAAGAALAGEPMLAAGARVGPWRVVRLLGWGGVSEVYLAERQEGGFGQRVALKVLKRGMDSRAILQGFWRERQILARLDHPNLARLVDGGRGAGEVAFFALEWVDGEPITDYCRRHALDVKARVRLMRTVCEAVASAHRQLVVHRDLKPDNVLVTADGTVKLLDFGIAKLLAMVETEAAAGGEPAGALAAQDGPWPLLTPAYAAPEQVLGEPVSTATDVYALGVMLYELVAGELPFGSRGQSRRALSAAGMGGGEAAVRPRDLLPRRWAAAPTAARPAVAGLTRAAAADLDAIVRTAWQRDPARRYPGVQEMAADLGRFLAGRALGARRGELAYRARKLLVRQRLPLAAGALALAALLGGLGLSRRETRIARAAALRADVAARRGERVTAFLLAVFAAPGGSRDAGAPPVTARDLLARGADLIDRGLAGEPEVQADVLEALAHLELGVGLDDPALAHARRALALRRAVLAPSDARIGRSWTLLGEAQAQHGDLAAAQGSFKAALAALLPAFGSDSVDAALADRGLASALRGPAQRRSLILLRSAHAVLVKRRGEGDTDTVDTLYLLAGELEHRQLYAEAETAYRRAAELYGRFAPRGVRVAVCQGALAQLLYRLGRSAQARPLFEAALAGERAALGPHHIQLAETLLRYGAMLIAERDYAAADRAFLEAQAIVGPNHYGFAVCQRQLGSTALERDRYAEAAALFTTALAAFRRTLGDNDLETWRCLASLGRAHLRLGQTRLAGAELTAAVGGIERVRGPEAAELGQPLRSLGELQLATGQAAAAVATLERDRALELKLFHDPEHRVVAVSDLALTRALVARNAPGDAAQARRLLAEALAVFGRLDPRGDQRGEALLLHARLALAAGDRPLARRDLTAAVPLLAARNPPAVSLRAARLLLAATSAGN